VYIKTDILTYEICHILTRDGNADQFGPFWLSPHLACKMQTGLTRPTFSTQAK